MDFVSSSSVQGAARASASNGFEAKMLCEALEGVESLLLKV
jgi:hypothetical protein